MPGVLKVGIAVDDEQAEPGHAGEHGLQLRRVALLPQSMAKAAKRRKADEV